MLLAAMHCCSLPDVSAAPSRTRSLPARVAAAGGIERWNSQDGLRTTAEMLRRSVTASSVDEALEQVRSLTALGHLIHAYTYMRRLYEKDAELYYATILAAPDELLPVVYTPTVGEACQKFGLIPMSARGCYVSIAQRGHFIDVLREYASAHLAREPDGTYACDCIVFSDGGRILGLGDLGAWGMGSASPRPRAACRAERAGRPRHVPRCARAHRRRVQSPLAPLAPLHPPPSSHWQARPVHSVRRRQPAPHRPHPPRHGRLGCIGQHRAH